MRTLLILLAGTFCFSGLASAQTLSRADAVAQALASNPTVKLSVERVALLEGRITEAKADALPDITWNTFAMRSRDPWDSADRTAPFFGGRRDPVDVHGGYHDASGDVSK